MDNNSGGRRQFLRQNLGSQRRCLKSAVAQVWTWRKIQSKSKTFPTTICKHEGLLCVVEDFSSSKTYHLQLHCLDKGTILWVQGLEELVHHTNPEEFLDLYETQESFICLNYSEIEEKAVMSKTIDRTIKKIKRFKEDPDYAKRKEDIQYFFEKMGIADTEFIDSKTRSFIYDFFKNTFETPIESKVTNIAGHRYTGEYNANINSNEAKKIESSKNIEIIDKIVSELALYDQRRSQSNPRDGSQKIGIFPKETEQKNEFKTGISNDFTIYSTIQHPVQEGSEEKRKEVTDEEEEGDYVEILHEERNVSHSSEALHQKELKNDFRSSDDDLRQYEFMQRNTLPIVKPRTVLHLPPAPPIPPKGKRHSFKKSPAPQPPDALDWFNAAVNDKSEGNRGHDNKMAVVPAPRRGRITKEDIGPPFNFQHLVHMG